MRQLAAVVRETLINLPRNTPLLSGADSYAFLDVDSTVNRVYGYAKQRADYGQTRVRGLHPWLATVAVSSGGCTTGFEQQFIEDFGRPMCCTGAGPAGEPLECSSFV